MITPSPLSWFIRAWRRLRAQAEVDVFPEFSARVRRFVYHPLGVLSLTALAALVCGLFLHAQGFVLAASVLAVIALGVVWPWLCLRGLSGTLRFDRLRATEGEAAEARLELRNRLPWAVWGLAVHGGLSGAGSTPDASIAVVPALRWATCRWRFTLRCRGVYPTEARLTSGFPFGLWDAGRKLRVESPLVVWPRTLPVGPVPSIGGDRELEGTTSRNRVGTKGDVMGVRPYRRGDSLRRVHWGQTARHDRLVVCEFQATTRPVIELVLDADPRVHAGEGTDSSREWAIRVVASFAKGWLEDGAPVGLAWSEGALPPESGRAQLQAILDALARLEECDGRPLADFLDSPARRRCTSGLQIVVTTNRARPLRPARIGEDAARRWVILNTRGFGDVTDDSAEPRSTVAPWLWIDSPEHVAALLRGGWPEARHGS